MQFKKGDRVRGLGYVDSVNLHGQTGTVCKDSELGHYVMVDWDNPISTMPIEKNCGIKPHNCNGLAKNGHGWNIPANLLEIISITNFKLGDRIECVSQYGPVKPGDTGKVIQIVSDLSFIELGVKWDKPESIFHSCGGKCENGQGYYIPEKNVKLAPPIVIGHTHTPEFKIGDLVICDGTQSYIKFIDEPGIICYVPNLDSEFENYGVEFHRPISEISPQDTGHNCNGSCKNLYGWFCSKDILKPQTITFNTSPTTLQYALSDRFIIGHSASIPSDWTILGSSPAPSPYIHSQPSYVGKNQVVNTIPHNKQIDEFLLLNL
jgi:hypothetical protein